MVLDNKHCANLSFFKELRSWLKEHNDTPLRKEMLKKITFKFLGNYTKMKKYRAQLLRKVKPKKIKPIQNRRDKYLREKYGITEQDYDKMLKDQNFQCDICGSTKNNKKKYFAVDHCHESGKVRGLLCDNCNTGLGQFKDTIHNLKQAIEYLKKNSI